MGVPHHERDSSSIRHQDSEEELPLYSRDLDIEDAGPVSLPEPTAGPESVREFLMYLLVSHRQLPVDHARRVAARWTLGSGQELRTYSPALYLSIFGPEEGWVLYKDVKVSIHKAKNMKKKFSERQTICGVAGCLLAWDILMALLLSLVREPVWIPVGAMFGLMFGVFVLLTTLMMLLIPRDNPEKEAEKELRRALVNVPHPQSGAISQ